MKTTATAFNNSEYVIANGPSQDQYELINEYFNEKYAMNPQRFKNEFEFIRKQVKAFHDKEGVVGFCFSQPYGYAGDFELIDRLYNRYISNDPVIGKWDDFAQSQPAAVAVRNRKSYFVQLMETGSFKKVLNVASGPCRDIREFFERNPLSEVQFDCIDLDEHAIRFAKSLLSDDRRVIFSKQDILRGKIEGRYDLVWSAGLFDYFNDAIFVRVLAKLLMAVDDGGELVIGNFADSNPNRAFMEVGMNWYLHHRSAQKLAELACTAGAVGWDIDIRSESEGVNLFLHIRKN